MRTLENIGHGRHCNGGYTAAIDPGGHAPPSSPRCRESNAGLGPHRPHGVGNIERSASFVTEVASRPTNGNAAEQMSQEEIAAPTDGKIMTST